jgi:hypothetical protein
VGQGDSRSELSASLGLRARRDLCEHTRASLCDFRHVCGLDKEKWRNF